MTFLAKACVGGKVRDLGFHVDTSGFFTRIRNFSGIMAQGIYHTDCLSI